MRRFALLAAAATLVSGLPTRTASARPASACPASAAYGVRDLGHLGGDEARASAINARGQIVGVSHLAGHTVSHAFLYENGAMTDLCDTLPPGTRCTANDVNASGQVAGTANLPDQTPVVFENGQVVALTEEDWFGGIAGGINDRGQVVGWAFRSSAGTFRAYLWEGASPRRDLGTLGLWSVATDVNDAGHVVGYSGLTTGTSLGFVWKDGEMTPLETTLGGTSNGANEINASGDIAGWSSTPEGETRPALYRASDGAVVDLGSLGGREGSAFTLNDLGHVVGYSYTADGQRHAFVYRDAGDRCAGGHHRHLSPHRGDRDAHAAGGRRHGDPPRVAAIEDLNDLIPAASGWELIVATGIDDAGRIVGYGCVGSRAVPPQNCESGYVHAFVLTPVPRMLADLIALVQGFGLHHGLERSLVAKLENAQKSLDKCNTGAACQKIGAFTNQVAAQEGKRLTSDEAEQLLAAAAEVRAALGCP